MSAVPSLLPYQQRWLNDRSRVKVWEKGRRIGASWTEALDSVLNAAADDGLDTWYTGYNRDMAQEFIADCAEWARRLDAAAADTKESILRDGERDIQAYEIRFASHHKITALSSSPRNLRGKQGRAVIDEAAFHHDLAGLLKAGLAFRVWGGCVRILSTHNGSESEFAQLCEAIRAGERRGFTLHRVDFDDALRDGLYRKICERTRAKYSAADEHEWRSEIFAEYSDDADEELLCIPRAGAGAFLSGALLRARVADAPVARLDCDLDFAQRAEPDRAREVGSWCEAQLGPSLATLDRKALHVFGFDFGRFGDLSVLWPLEIADGARRTPIVIEMRNVPFRQQEQVIAFVSDRMPRLVAAEVDARGSGGSIAESVRDRLGSRVALITMAREWYESAMPAMRQALEDAILSIPRDADILADLRSLRSGQDGLVKPPESRSRGRRGEKRHGDSAIALALANHAAIARPRAYSYQAPAARPAPDSMPMTAPEDEDDAPSRRARFHGF